MSLLLQAYLPYDMSLLKLNELIMNNLFLETHLPKLLSSQYNHIKKAFKCKILTNLEVYFSLF